MPYAIAAKMAYPQRPVIAIVGDGAMQMNGNAEMLTVKQYWKQALAYLKALAKIDPDQWKIIKQSAKQLLPF